EELLVGAPRLSLLVTSRVPLQLRGEARYAVPPLDLPDPAVAQAQAVSASGAVELFVERAKEHRPEFELVDENAAAVAELCVRLDGLPPALELAAARVRLLSPGAILARVGRRLAMLRTTGSAVPERYR